MWQSTNFPWWFLFIAGLLIVFSWPPAEGKSLAVKFVNWAVDPWDELPVLPRPLSLGEGDDPDKVLEYDLESNAYYLLHLKGGWTRKRLELKVARDPFDPATERQVLSALGVMAVLLGWRFGWAKRMDGARLSK